MLGFDYAEMNTVAAADVDRVVVVVGMNTVAAAVDLVGMNIAAAAVDLVAGMHIAAEEVEEVVGIDGVSYQKMMPMFAGSAHQAIAAAAEEAVEALAEVVATYSWLACDVSASAP